MTTLLCPAKVNLFLAITGKEDSGYHTLDSVMVRVPQLCDVLEITPADRLEFEAEGAPNDDSNSVLKALKLLEKETGKQFHYKIHLTKNIPAQSGLGGASSNAASLLLFLNEQKQLGFTNEQLMEFGAQIGMDLPFFISGHKVAHATHFGEKIAALPDLPSDLKLEIAFSHQSVSTVEAYQKWDDWLAAHPKSHRPKTSEAFRLALKNQDSKSLMELLHNDFETSQPELCARMKAQPGTVMTGSGGAFVRLEAIKNC
jgi:4-diphosphocytidyl-2-C-methyl-D-erythritol kinase